MTITFRGDAVQVNATAQTSIMVNVPAGVQLDDYMLAFVFVADDKTITPPAGWVHRQTVTTAGTDARMAFYTRQATGSEPSSYTWTLNVAERAWGYLIAYDGVDLAAPIVSIVADAFDSGSCTRWSFAGWGLVGIPCVGWSLHDRPRCVEESPP